ncbi:MAG TPA: YrdB family protein [Microbacterium sp.]|nr:YrdB family protein [Microbacterium sp.]
MSSATGSAGIGPRVTALDVLRLLSELLAFGSLCVWGFLAWSMPWSIVWGIGAPLVAILIWALFLSPKAVIALPRAIRTLIELLVFVSATLALWALDLPWAGLAVGAFCVVVGVFVLRREMR